MSDTDALPMTDGDITPPATTGFTPAAPLKDSGVEFDPAGAQSRTDQAKQTIKDQAGKIGGQASDRIRTLADTGKEKAGGALDQLSQMIGDAAGQVDEKLGAQYGDYARQAAGAVSRLSDQVKGKDVDDLLEDVRGFVRQSPGIAIGVAAALGFAAARLIQSGIDDQRA
ncbi:hypothetical protein D9601_04360 [Sphingomonas sp. MA1305]|uniref:hypothetical protein n=1 Tax=Sphingomonas sp. MA1305 TaxID=2479204 RepID=UPI0018DF3747|nr:hypothetical protein [Sphingomonas sp. MA1305]MBI0474595.1 hypothetical protein [Sphingomonas sp. MA1305]